MATTPAALTESEVAGVVGDVARDFPAARHLADARPTGRFQSHTSTFYELTLPGENRPAALLKVGAGWTADEARRVHDDIVFLRGLVEGHRPLGVAEALGWHSSPPSICLGFVPGDDLGRLLRSGDVQSWLQFAGVIEECGALLGRFHRQSPQAGQSVDPSALRTTLESMARTVMIRPWFLDAIDLVGASARRYGDFAPYNIRVDAEGRGWVIDHPSPPALEPAHRDVAWFLFNLERRLGWDASVDREQLEAAREQLVGSFEKGYRRSGLPIDTPADRALLALYRSHRALWTARRRLRQRELQEVPAYLRLAWRWRKAASEPR